MKWAQRDFELFAVMLGHLSVNCRLLFSNDANVVHIYYAPTRTWSGKISWGL